MEKKGSTCGTAVGAKQGRMKGNKQKAKYQNQEVMNEKSVRKEWGRHGKRKQDMSTEKSTVRMNQEVENGRNRKSSSAVLKLK